MVLFFCYNVPMYLSGIFIVFVLLHAIDEFKTGLAPYLEEAVGFKTGRWLNYVLLVLALSIILLPFILVQTVGLDMNLARSFVIGGLLGDAFSTHWIPSLIRTKVCPGSISVAIYPFLAFIIFNTATFSLITFILGILAFAALWPSLWIIKYQARSPIVN